MDGGISVEMAPPEGLTPAVNQRDVPFDGRAHETRSGKVTQRGTSWGRKDAADAGQWGPCAEKPPGEDAPRNKFGMPSAVMDELGQVDLGLARSDGSGE